MNNLGPETDIQTEENREKPSETASIPKETKAYSSMPPRYPQPPQYAIPPVQQRHQGRRVGTVTMACALIAVGVLLIIGSFNQSISFLMMARLAPIILIVLGIEILVRYFVSKGEKLRYDFLSGFVCFVLIMGSLGMAAIPEVWNNWGPHREILEETLRAEANQICAKALKDEKSVSSMNLSVQLHHSDLPEEMTLEDLRAADFVRADLIILNSFQNEEDFVKAAQPILKKMADTGIPFDYINITTPSVEMRYGYSLYLEDSLGYDLTVEQLLDNISVYYDDSTEYDEDYEEMEAFAENYLEEFHIFVEQYAEAMPEAYPARCRAFASHFQEQFDAFLNGEEVVFPQSNPLVPKVSDALEEQTTVPDISGSGNEAA